MVSEIYPGYLTYVGGNQFPIIYDPQSFANFVDTILDTEHCGGSTSFALWLFAVCTDFGFWGGTLWDYEKAGLTVLTPTYDMGGPVDDAGRPRPLFYLLRDVLKKHGATIPDEPLPATPPVAAYGEVVLNSTVSLWNALPALATRTVHSSPVRTMEELGQGYGYIMYSAPLPPFEAGEPPGSQLTISGMRDRALIYFDRGSLYQTCSRGTTPDAIACSAPAATPASTPASQLDILVENQGRVTGGLTGTELPFRGIRRYVAMRGLVLANWTIRTLPLNNTNVLEPLWRTVAAHAPPPPPPSAASATPASPAFFRGTFTIPAGKVADTFLTLTGWDKGQAWINGVNLARYWSSVGPQYSFYCPAGWLVEGLNEVILFETGVPKANLTVEFKAAHTTVGPQPPPPTPPPPPQVCPAGWVAHPAGFWQNPWPCGLSGTPGCHVDYANVSMDACAHKCVLTKGCLGFEVYQVLPKACYLFVDELKLPFIPNPDCATCVRNQTASVGSVPLL